MSLPPSELWSKFQSAVIFARGVLSAAIAVVQRAPATQPELLLLTASEGVTDPPAAPTDGANIEGFRTVNLFVFGAGNYVATLAIWVYNGSRWLPLTTLDVSEADGALNALDTEGYARVFVQATVQTGAAHSVGVFPYNVED